ncbi:glycosyltransferase family 4 protein [Brevibacillus reuszeri]|uniref:glycosyltransferase family 4 protein n=1 Tax=Brevibacillus reuszeri TaxID=54915 RepID=UPI000CCC722B|nr:glycosyltransferase family 4 protein [Brevibacillus reuszeri]
MRICFFCNLIEFKPKGNVLQFFILLRALDRKVAQLPTHEREQYSLDCVLPFQFRNGMGGFTFQHVQFYKSNHPIDDIIRRDQKKRYDYIFIRGRNDAIKLLDKRPALGSKLLFLAIQYNLNDPYIMRRLNRIFKHARLVFFQTEPNANRYRTYQLQKGNYSSQELDRKIQVLPQFVEPPKDSLSDRPSRDHLDLILAGVIRPRYGLGVATKAIRFIRRNHPKTKLRVLYPSIVGKYQKQAKALLRTPGVVDHGQKSMWATKKLILRSGIGIALLYDTTSDQNPSHSYLSRILEYMALGVPVLTTRTIGNEALLGENYPLFVLDAYDIAEQYEKLCDPFFYEEMSRYVSTRGERFLADNAVQSFWATLQHEYVIGQLAT